MIHWEALQYILLSLGGPERRKWGQTVLVRAEHDPQNMHPLKVSQMFITLISEAISLHFLTYVPQLSYFHFSGFSPVPLDCLTFADRLNKTFTDLLRTPDELSLLQISKV